MNDILKSFVWYHKGQAREFPILSCYALKLELHNGTIVDGYYYRGQFYHRYEKITNLVKRWMVLQYGENPQPT